MKIPGIKARAVGNLSNVDIANITSKAVFDKVASLKTNPSVVSCFLLNNKVVSLGTGTKSFSDRGALRDCHAEVLARRGFLLYLMRNINNPAVIKDGKLLHKVVFYTSKVPCGDCSTTILDKSQSELENLENIFKMEIWRRYNTEKDSLVVRGRLFYDKIGVLRTKPGRMDAENSNLMSCSDKIAKWICLGIGGALMNLLLEPIYISKIVIGGPDWDEASLKRGLLERTLEWRKSQKIADLEPDILYSGLEIPWDISQKSHESIVWIGGEKLEVLVKGRKRGFGAKNGIWNEKSSSMVSKKNLKKAFLTTSQSSLYDTMTYGQLKSLATNYQERKSSLYSDTFKGWITSCPSFDEF